MQLKNMTKEDLEILSYTDLTEIILNESKKTLNTAAIFHKICDLLGYSDEEYTSKIGDYYTSLTTDKRFIFLENGEWDLSKKHPVKIELDDDDEDDEIEESEEDEPIEEEEEESIDDENIDDDLDTEDDDIEDLAILSEEELEEN